MPYKARNVANEFLQLARSGQRELTPLQVIKLVYIAHGWHLAVADSPLLEETVEAWQYGPVISDLYQSLKIYGRSPVEGLIPSEPCHIDSLAKAVIHHTWSSYKEYSGAQLSSLTHQEDSPWWTAWYKQGGRERRGFDIPDDLIKEHYKRLASDRLG